MSYGRLTWSDWAKEQKRNVEQNAEAFEVLSVAALNWLQYLTALVNPEVAKDKKNGVLPKTVCDNWDKLEPVWRLLHSDVKGRGLEQHQRHNIWRWLRSRDRAIRAAKWQVERLKATFELTQTRDGWFPGGDDMPIKLEIVQQLHEAMVRYSPLFLDAESHGDGDKSFSAFYDRVWPGARMEKRTDAPIASLNAFRHFLIGMRHGPHHGAAIDLLNCCHKYTRALDTFALINARKEATLGFSDLAKSLLIDECPHAIKLLQDGLLKGEDESNKDRKLRLRLNTWIEKLAVFDPKNQKRDISGIREMPDRYRVLTPFKFDRFLQLSEKVKDVPGWEGFWQTVNVRVKDYLTRDGQGSGKPTDPDEDKPKRPDRRIYLTPSSRFLVSVALSLTDDPFKELGIEESGVIDPERSGLADFFEEPSLGDGFSARRSIIASRFDPLPKVYRDLKISSFITTNYDFEIERYFQDNGFRSFSSAGEDGSLHSIPHAKSRKDSIGRSMRDQTFYPDKAAELAGFALGAAYPGSGIGVYHLHGRATREDPMVITERDYMELYLQEDKNRPTIDEAIQTAFSGGPLLFLGLGMEETDLLRPLRQFISNRDRTIGYTSIALLPAERNLAARSKFSAGLYLRYGVHTIFYGSGKIAYDKEQKTPGVGEKKSKAPEFGLDWLHRIIALIEGLEAQLDQWENEPVPDPYDRKAEYVVRDLLKAVGNVGSDIAVPEVYPATTEALRVLLNVETKASVSDIAMRILGTAKAPDGRACKLRTCDFTPTRPGRHNKGPHADEASVDQSGDVYLGFYTDVLFEILKIVVGLPERFWALSPKDEIKKQVAPIRLALKGIRGAFITGSLNAALDSIHKEQKIWWQNWQESPRFRLAEAQRVPTGGSVEDWFDLGTSFVRHKLDNIITPMTRVERPTVEGDLLEVKEGTPHRLAKVNRTHIRAFDTFVAAVACTFEHRKAENASAKFMCDLEDRKIPEVQCRQFITVAARRGMGKGTFMSAFLSPLGQATYKRASWPDEQVFFAGKLYINFGFSPEIGSVYDTLVSSLVTIITTLETRRERQGRTTPGGNSPTKLTLIAQRQKRQKLDIKIKRLSRLAGLEDLFKRFARAAAQYTAAFPGRIPRLLVNLCAVDLLFDQFNQAKNGEIQRFIELLFSDALADCPVDLVFLADDSRLGEPWSHPKFKASHKRMLMDRRGLPLLADEQIQKSQTGSQLVVDETPKERTKRLGRDRLNAKRQTLDRHFVHFTRPVNSVWLMVDNFPVLATAMFLIHPPKHPSDHAVNGMVESKVGQGLVFFETAVDSGLRLSDELMDEIWQKKDLPEPNEISEARYVVRTQVRQALERIVVTVADACGILKDGEKDYETALRERVRNTNNQKLADQWRQTRRGLGNSRFALTILLSAAENTIIHGGGTKDKAKEAEDFILDTVARVRNVGQERRDQMVLETVLDAYRDLHVIGEADLDCELHMLILRHLGVIASPVGSAVLVRLSEIREYFARIGIETDVSRRRFLVRALNTMAYRGLVFRLDPHPRLVSLDKDDAPWPAALEYRYALHRVVQSYALRHLNAGPNEPVQNNRFSPTLYAAMPSAGPQLSRTSYRFLRSLIIGLSQYPDIPSNDLSAEPWLFTTRDTSVKVQAVRAALTVARSNFSVAVVSRLSVHDDVTSGMQSRGYLETYKVRLRWIIRMAWELFDKDANQADLSPEGPHSQVNVLYRDEIVWIYNELGVISLAQGSLSDALGYLRQAAEENERIEGLSRTAPIYNHIDLNHAIVQMERGNFESARTRFKRVYDATDQIRWRLNHTAKGYLCVLDHLTGRREGVAERFREVCQFFQVHQEDRAAAIMLMHYARFQVDEAPQEAEHLTQLARNLAQTSGHEDIRQQIELSAVRLRVRREMGFEFIAGDLKTISEVEEFGKSMAIWNLQVDALWLRAKILLLQNETATAGRLLTRAMAIARRHSMTLRLNSCMTTYAEVLLCRGDLKGAQSIASQSLELAKRTGYSLETARAQAVISECAEGLTET